jgi:2-methylcitrate dehydratase PrpD
VTAIDQFAQLISTAPREHDSLAIGRSRAAFIDTLACMFAGSSRPVAQKALAAVKHWGQGESPLVGQAVKLNPPFAAMVNGAAAHALDYDDFDEPANAHPSAVIFPALLALAAERSSSGLDLLDAHIVGVEIMQRLGEAMNMDHYRRGWLSTLTLGSIGAAAACARLQEFDHATATAALSLAASMASGLTNQSGFLAKQLHPGLAAKNGVMASALAGAGISASDQVIDGPISLARSMGDYDQHKFEAALAKLGNPWSIVEHGLIMKAYPSCGYAHRLIDAAIDLHTRLPAGAGADADYINSILISVPDYYLDLLVYPRPRNPDEAMFSAEYSVAAALTRGGFGLAELSDAAVADPELRRLASLVQVSARRPRDSDIVYDPLDPDFVEMTLADGSCLRSEIGLPTGAPSKPMDEAARRAKFDQCLEPFKTVAQRDDLWALLNCLEQQDNLAVGLGL